MVGSTRPPDENAVPLPERLAEALPERHPLRQEYRQLLAVLRASGGSCSVAELTRHLVERPASRTAGSNAYQSRYLSLHHQRLPMLVTLGLVEYDETDGSVTLLDATDAEPPTGESSRAQL